MYIREVMTRNPVCCRPSDTLDTAAKLMLENDCGSLPVCDGPRLAGLITDRDIACRAVATGKAPVDVPVKDIMTRNVYSVRENTELDVALELMEEQQVRRLPVVDENGRVIGIISQADLASRLPTLKVAQLVRSVSKRPRQPMMAL